MSVSIFFTRLSIFAWRQICFLYTYLIYGKNSSLPSFLLKFETPTQKKCYSNLNIGLSSDIDRNKKRILIIIPFRDKWFLTEKCLKSLFEQDLQDALALVALVDNGSIENETIAGINNLMANTIPPGITIRNLRYAIPFNYSKLNNLAVADCRDFDAQHIVFLNNDVVMTEPKTLTSMVSFLTSTKDAASVGCTLLYPNQKIQHLFISVGCKIVGAHPFRGQPYDLNDPWYQSPRPVGAATAALLVVDRILFELVEGFEEALPSCYQDVDLALKFQKTGRANWVLPWISAIHYETQTRSPIHSWDEVSYMYRKWGDELTSNHFFSKKISRWSERIFLSLGEGSFPWKQLVPH